MSFYAALMSFLSITKKRLFGDESGATAVEYGLIIGLIAVLVVGALVILGPQIQDMFMQVSEALPGGEG
ncbi:Flp family type IVb pilin [Arthrobacter sp. GCM10027362]|uniref:Flp family type IVb pilin n=1 Tax=Arthrobacter sp. GCM10027362 TaxID=3273379 RepID=UPI003637C9FB